jgi:hypothetical protein
LRLPNAYQIANAFTLIQIDAQIASYMSALNGATQGSYRLDTTQGNQQVTPANPDQVSSLLSIWLKARDIKAGTYAGSQLTHVNYTP